MKYTTVTLDEYNKAIAYKSNEDIKIESIRETFIPNINKKLTNDGKLYIKLNDTNIHLYKLWDIENNIDFKNIITKVNPWDHNIINYESTHRIILTKDKNPVQSDITKYAYSAQLMKIGKENNKWLYLLDTEYVPNLIIRKDGYFESDTELKSTNVYPLYINYSDIIYLNIPNIGTTQNNPQFFYTLDTDPTNSNSIKYNTINLNPTNKEKYYYKKDVELDKNSNNYYLVLKIFGNSDAPDQICLEVR